MESVPEGGHVALVCGLTSQLFCSVFYTRLGLVRLSALKSRVLGGRSSFCILTNRARVHYSCLFRHLHPHSSRGPSRGGVVGPFSGAMPVRRVRALFLGFAGDPSSSSLLSAVRRPSFPAASLSSSCTAWSLRPSSASSPFSISVAVGLSLCPSRSSPRCIKIQRPRPQDLGRELPFSTTAGTVGALLLWSTGSARRACPH